MMDKQDKLSPTNAELAIIVFQFDNLFNLCQNPLIYLIQTPCSPLITFYANSKLSSFSLTLYYELAKCIF